MDYKESIDKMEHKRKLITKRILYSIGIVIITILIGLAFNPEFGYIIGGVIGLIIAVGLISDSVNKYKKDFKNQVMPLIIAKSGLDLQYQAKDGVGELTTQNSKLFKKSDRYFKEDLMYGTFDDVRFMSSDVEMQERRVTRDSKGRRRVNYVPYFKGRWFVYEFNKEFNGIIQVREDSFLQGHPWGLKVNKIELEDVEFNKKFKTYATNEHDAFYVLTPSLMENVKKLEQRFPGQIYFSFIENQLHIAINHAKDSFEPPIFSPFDESFINETVSDILDIQKIVNELRLNRKIFK